MRERVAAGSLSFSYASDLEPVLDMYRRGFVQAFEGYRKLRGIAPGAGTTIFYGNLGWEAAEALELAKVIAFIGGHCEMTEGALELVLSGNKFGPAGVELLQKAIEEVGGKQGGKLFATGLRSAQTPRTGSARGAPRVARSDSR